MGECGPALTVPPLYVSQHREGKPSTQGYTALSQSWCLISSLSSQAPILTQALSASNSLLNQTPGQAQPESSPTGPHSSHTDCLQILRANCRAPLQGPNLHRQGHHCVCCTKFSQARQEADPEKGAEQPTRRGSIPSHWGAGQGGDGVWNGLRVSKEAEEEPHDSGIPALHRLPQALSGD